MTNKVKTLNIEISKGSQSLDYKELLELNGQKLKIQIKSDSYDMQCYARISVFDNLKWNQIDFIPYNNMKTRDGLYYEIPHVKTDIKNLTHFFTTDRAELIKRAQLILDN